MTQSNQVLERIDGYRERVIRLQSELTSRVALGPENGGEGEHEKSEYIKGLLMDLKPDFLEEFKAPDPRARAGYRPNLIARWGSERNGPTVWVLSHSDVVPPGDLSLWDGDPYTLRVEGDKLIGRGVEDNQHGFVSSYLALQAIQETGIPLEYAVGLAIVADEETGSGCGLDYLLAHHRDLFDAQDLIVVPDAGNEEGTMIEVAEKSMLWLRFTVTGKQCHASTPDKGRNSLVGAARLIVALEALRERFDASDALFRPPLSTFEPTKIKGNVPNVNTIPGRDVFYMDCRVLPQYSLDEVLNAAQEIAVAVGGNTHLEIRLDTVNRQDAAPPTSPQAPVVMALAGAIHRITGKDASPMGIGGGTVAAFFRKAGLPAAVWSTISDTAHQPNEYCRISKVLTDAKIFAFLYLGIG